MSGFVNGICSGSRNNPSPLAGEVRWGGVTPEPLFSYLEHRTKPTPPSPDPSHKGRGTG